MFGGSMASAGAEEDGGAVWLDIDNVHMLLQVEHEQIQKRTFTNWINAQLAKRCPPSYVSDLFSDLRDGSQLLDLLEVMSGQPMKRQKGHGLFQQRTNIETALTFLKEKSIKLVNINIPDIIDGRPSIVLGLVWTIILHCHIEELASTLSFSSCHSSVDSLLSLDSWPGSPVPLNPIHPVRTSPLHRHFRIPAKKALLMWVRDQCQRVGSSVSVKDFKSSWRSGEAFLVILSSLRPQLVDLSLVQTRSNRENLEVAFSLAERELHIPRLLELQDVDVEDPDEKSIMTYVAQFLQYSNDMPEPGDHLQVSPRARAQEMTRWLQQAYQELAGAWKAAAKSNYADKYQVFQSLAGSFSEQRRPMMAHLVAVRRCPELSQEQHALRTSWDHLEEELQRCKSDLDLSLPPPLDTVIVWLQRAEAVLTEEGGSVKDHTEARALQDTTQTMIKEMSQYEQILDAFNNVDDSGNVAVPPEKLMEIQTRLTYIRVTAKYQGVKLEYRELLDLVGRIGANVQTWKGPYVSKEAVHVLLQDWHEKVERQGMLLILRDALRNLKEKANVCTREAALGGDFQLVARQLKEAEGEVELVTQTAVAARGTMERTVSAWETYNTCLASLQTWLEQATQTQIQTPAVATQDINEWASCQAKLNEVGNFLIEVTEASTSRALAEQLSKVNMQWAECMKKAKFEASSKPAANPLSFEMVHSLTQEASWLLRQPLEVASVSLKSTRQKLQLLGKRLAEVDLSSLQSPSEFPTSRIENLLQTVPQMLGEAERTCVELQRAASKLEGRLAELDHWSTDALDSYQDQKGHSALDPTVKVLISQGLQLENQALTAGQDLQDLVAHVQKTSPLQNLSTCDLQQKLSKSVSDSQDIVGMLSSLGFPVHETQTQAQSEPFVGARSNDVEQIETGTLSPQPQIDVPREVDSKAPSMARSRLKKTRLRLQGRIQQSIKLFGGREISESQAKKKQKALKILQPVVLDDFLNAVEGFEAFCSGPQLQGLTLLSDSVKKQWEDVRREMAAFVLTTQSKLREENQSCSAVPCVIHTNTRHKATDRTDPLQQLQAAAEGAASVEGSLPLCETLAQSKSSWLATDQLRESDEAQGTQASGAVAQVDGRGQKLGGNTLLRATGMSASTQRGHNLPVKQSVDLSPLAGTAPRPLQQSPSHVQAVIPEAVAPTYIERTGLESYRQSCPVLPAQLQKNKQRLERVSPDPATISTLHKQNQDPEALKQETDARCLGFELQHAQPSQSAFLMTREDLSDVERDQEKLTRQSGGQQMCLQSRMASLESNAELIKSADDLMALIAKRLDRIVSDSVEICSFTVVDPRLGSDLKEMDAKLQSEIEKLSDQSSEEEERQQLESTSSSSFDAALHNSVRHLQQLRRQLERVHSAAQALDHFLAMLREIKGAIPTLLADQDPNRQQNKADWEQERRSWQATMQQSLHTAAQQSDSVDCILKAAGITLTMGGATVTCRDVVKSLSKHVVDVEETPTGPREPESQDEMDPIGKELMHRTEELNPANACEKKIGGNSPQWEGAPEREPRAEDESQLEAKRSRLLGENDTKTQEEEHKAQSGTSKGDVDERRGRGSIQVKGDEERVIQRRAALVGALREIRGAAELLGLQEPSLPALQQRSRVFRNLQSRVAGLLTELKHIQDASSSRLPDVSQAGDVENLLEETAKAVTERLEQCGVLTELLKRFQSIRGDLSGTLQRAESTISEQSSYLGKDNLQRLRSRVQETKAELNGLGEGIDEVRCVCRQLYARLRQIPECTIIPFENEADALMDHWLDISERTDCHLDNLHVSLTLWDVVLQLGAEVESWTANKLAAFAESPPFQNDNDIKTLQSEIAAQEEKMKHFHQRAAEIQSLLQSTELPLELQVVETQMRKRMEQLKELVSDAEDVYRQMVAAKEQITARMGECFNSLQRIQDSILTLSGSDVATILAKLKELCWQLQTQDEQAEGLLEDLRIMASVTSPDNLQSLCVDGAKLQEELRNSHQLFSTVEERTVKNVQDLDRLQRESEYLEQWLQTAEKKSLEEDDVSFLQEETCKQRVRAELLCQLASSFQQSPLQPSTPLEKSRELLQRYDNFHTCVLGGSNEKQRSLCQDTEAPQTESKHAQKLNHAQAVISTTAGGETRPVELRVAGSSLSHRRCDQDDLKQDVWEAVQTTEEEWGDLLQLGEPFCSVQKVDSEFTSSHPAQQREARHTVEALKTPTWPGTAERGRARQLHHETESLQLTLSSQAEQAGDTVWTDSTWAELDSCWSGQMEELTGVCSRLEEGVSNEEHFGQFLQHCHRKLTSLQDRMSACQAQKESSAGSLTDLPSLEALLEEMPDIEKHLLELAAIKADSIPASSTSEAQARLSQQVRNLQNHKRAVESVIRAKLGLQRIQHVKEDVRCVETTLQDLNESVRNLFGHHKDTPDIKQLKQQWCTIQHGDNRLIELAAGLYDLQKAEGSSIAQEKLPADVTVTAEAVAKDLESFRSVFVQKKQQCAENTAKWVRQVIRQLQRWIQTVQAEPSSPSQAGRDEGLWLQQSLRDVLSETDFLQNCVGSKVSKELETCALDALDQSTLALETLPKGPVTQHLAAQPETFKIVHYDQQQEAPCERVSLTPKKVFTIVLDMKPEQVQQDGNLGADEAGCTRQAGTYDEKPTEPSSDKSAQPSTSVHLKKLNSAAQSGVCQAVTGVKETECVNTSVYQRKVFTIVLDMQQRERARGGTSDGPRCSGGAEQHDEQLEEVLNSSTSHDAVAEESTLPGVKQEDGEEFSDSEEQEPALAETQKPVGDNKQAARVSRGQLGIQENMDPTALGLSADLGAAEMTDGAPESCQHRHTMQDILFQTQSAVEKSNFINRRPHTDLTWSLQSCSREADIRLVRTVQQALACRYQPARLGITAMVKQLEQAEEHRRCVQEQVATMKSDVMVCDLKRSEDEWSAALLDASATVQVKAAQLEQVKRFHKQMKLTRAFQDVLAAEKEKMSSKALESSADQADKLRALLQTVKQKKRLMEELLQLSSQLSVHLSEAESSGALLAWLGGVQEEWRLLEGSVRRAFQHATNSTSQFLLLMKEAKELKAKLEALQMSNFESGVSKSELELVCVRTELTMYNQLYSRLQFQSDALVHFCLGDVEKNKLQQNLQELGTLLNIIEGKLDTSTNGYSVNINKQLRDLIVWAKQAENQISVGQKLALFPEEARIQIGEMKKLQTNMLSRRCKIEEIKNIPSDLEKDKSDQVLKTAEGLYEAIAHSLDHVLDTMKKNVQERDKLLSHMDGVEAWLAETRAARDCCAQAENVSTADIQKLEMELQSHKSATAAIESQLNLVEAMAESCEDMAATLSPGESRYLVNRVSGLWTELEGMVGHEKAKSWELEELIHERSASDEDLSTIRTSLNLIASELEQLRFPVTRETLSRFKRRVIEHQCQVQELKHCQEAKRSSLLHIVGELKDACRALSLKALEQDKYLYLRRRMEEFRDAVNTQMERAKGGTLSVDERFTRCQTLLVELPLVKTQCEEAGVQLEAMAPKLHPSELRSERQRVHHTVETLVSWERSLTEDVKTLEGQLLRGMSFSSELPALIELFQRTGVELKAAKPVSPDEKAIDGALQRYRVLWRNMESAMRVLESLGQKENLLLKKYTELYALREAAMQECHLQMESLSQARVSLKAYHCAAEEAVVFLHNSEATFCSAQCLDCAEEQRQIRLALKALEVGFQPHIRHLAELIPKQTCISRSETEQLHISILCQLLVGRAVLNAQAQHRLESLQRCAVRQQSLESCREEVQQRLSEFQTRLSECAVAQVTSHDKSIAQQQKIMLLKMDLQSLAGEIEELSSGCLNQACVAGRGGELRTLWRRWLSLRQHVGLLMAHAQQRQEEWKDITASMEQCCSLLASSQAEVLDSSSLTFTHQESQQLLAQAEVHHAGLEREQQLLASLEHRLAHALSVSASQGAVGKTLVKIQENVRSLKERNLLVLAAAQAEEKERLQIQEEIGELEKHMFTILPTLDVCADPSKQQELRKDLSSQKAKLKSIMDGVRSRYAVIPAHLSRRLNDVQLHLRGADQKLFESSSLAQKIAGQVAELSSGLENVQVLLEQQSPTVGEAQTVLKHVWDELDVWHSHLMLLENEVQDLAEEHPGQAHLLMDRLTQPLQLYQNTAQKAEQRTSFLSKIPACLQEFENILHSSSCWLDEAQTWLSTHCAFTTARSLQNHANSLQLVLDDSERIRVNLQNFRSVLAEISAVCDVRTQDDKLKHNDQQVHEMQCNILTLLEQLLQAAEVADSAEAELKTMERNFMKIRTILSSMENSNITLTEHLQNRQVILANVKSMQNTLEDLHKCKGDFHLPQELKEGLSVFSQAGALLQQLEELEHITQQQASLLEEAFEVSNSEEEESEDGESCHSSSSDTLTGSIPEDPVETFSRSDVQSEDVDQPCHVKEAESLTCQVVEAGLSLVNSEFPNTDFTSDCAEASLDTMDFKADVGEAFCHETAKVESGNVRAAPGSKGDSTAAYGLEKLKSPKHETVVPGPRVKTLQTAAVVGDTRLIPARPVTPFITTEFIVREDLCQSTAPPNDLVTSASKGQRKVGTSLRSLEESQAPAESKTALSSGEHEDGERHPSWSRLDAQISQKLTTLKKVQDEQQTHSSSEDGGRRGKALEKRSACAVLQGTHESITTLRQTVRSANSSQPGVKEKLCEAVHRVTLCLDSLTDFLLTPDSDEDDSQLRLQQHKRLTTDLDKLAELLEKMVLSGEEPDALHCLTCLQDCLHTVQLVFTLSSNQLHEHQELSSKQLCALDEFDLGQSEIFPPLRSVPTLEQCVLGRHLTEGPGEKARLQQASRSLLQGIFRLLELGDECVREAQMNRVHNRSQLQAVLCGRKKLLQVLESQLAFVQHLFQSESEALKCQEDEWVQLEIRAKALQQRALEQEVVFQTSLQEWTRWEDNCGRLGRVLDESDAFISSKELEGDAEEFVIQHRADACQRSLTQLDESSAALGRLLNQRDVLQKEPVFAPSVGLAGGALELRWRSAHRWTEQEVQRCRAAQDSWTRFHTDLASVNEWMNCANKHLKSLSDLADTSDLNQCIQSHMIKLLDFSMEVEAMSVRRTSVAMEGAKLIHLRESDCPRVRGQVTQLEASWTQLTSDLCKAQDQLQQQLLAAWPPRTLLSDLEDWLRNLESGLNKEKEIVLVFKDAAHVTEVLQHFKGFKAGLATGQFLLDFLCQSGPQILGADTQPLQCENTIFAEKLGALRFQWLHVQSRLDNQIWEAEQIHHTCAGRERRLKHQRGVMVLLKEQLNKWKKLTGQSLIHKALLECEAAVGRVKEVAAALQELKAIQVNVDEEEAPHPCDVAFCNEADCVSHACWDLCQQMEALRPALQQTAAEWSRHDRALREAALHGTWLRCALQHQRTPLFSIKQAERYTHLLQQLEEKAGKGDVLWAAVEQSYQCLVKRLHGETAQAQCDDQMEGERKRWKDAVRELTDEQVKTAETLSLWQVYSRLSENCRLHLEQLLCQWEEMSGSSLSPEQDVQAALLSVQTFQDATEDLQRSVGHVLAASEALTARLQPRAADLVQSEARIMSRDVQLLSQAVSGKKKSLEENLDDWELFNSRVDALDERMQGILWKLEGSSSDVDSVQQVHSELSGLFPSLVDVRDMSGCVALNNRETERLQRLSREWIRSMTLTLEMKRGLEQQHSANFHEKCKNLMSIKERLKQESLSRKAERFLSLQEVLTAHQRLQAEVISGHQHLRALLCDAVTSMGKETGEKRSELLAQVSCVRASWSDSVAVADRSERAVKEQLRLWRTFQHGLRRLWKLLRDADPLLALAGSAPCAVSKLRSCADGYKCVEEALVLHATVFTKTLEAGRRLCESVTESESLSRLQSECQAIEEAWQRTNSQLGRRAELINTAVQKWTQFEDGVNDLKSELDDLKTRLRQQLPERPETFIQGTELSLQHLASGLRKLGTMKTDLSQCVAAGDSALLEQQLEQLHGQWEELCMKVSVRRQEIADRLNAWTIFNDKNKEFCDWLTQMENKVCHSGDVSVEEMIEKLKKDCMEEINLFSENKSHLKQLGEQLLLASDEAKQTQVHGSLQGINQRWTNLFHHIEARVKKLKETLATVQQLDKNMSNLRSWLSRIGAELSRPIAYSVCHHQEIQRRLAEQQELQRDIEQQTEGVASVLSLCDVLLRDEDAAGGTEAESDSLQETSRSLDQRWRSICAMALDRRLRIEETWRLWCKFLDDYSRFEDWLKMAERAAADPNSADVLYTVAKEELKKFEGFQRQVHERLTQLELINNQYCRLARENRTDRASQLKAKVSEGNRRWDALHRRVAAILRRLKYFTSQREEFEGTRDTMLLWLTELDLQLTNVEHFSESDVHHKMQQLNSLQQEITLNTERIDGLIVFGEGLIQKSSPQDAALIEDELEELHSYCQEVFNRLVRFHQRLSQPPMVKDEAQLSGSVTSLESSLELICRPWISRNQGSLPATPTHLLASPLERSGRETPVSVDSLPLEWDPSGDVGGSSSHEDEEEEEADEEERTYFSALSVPSRSKVEHDSSNWSSPGDTETEPVQLDTEGHAEAASVLTSSSLTPAYLSLMSQCSGSIEDIKRVSLILDDEQQQQQELGLSGLTASDNQSGVIQRWELLQAQPRSNQQAQRQQAEQLTSDLTDITSWLDNVIPELDQLQQSNPAAGIEHMEAKAKELKEMEKVFTHYKSVMLSVNLRAQEAPELRQQLASVNRDWSRADTGLQQWDASLRKSLMQCQEFHETLHSLLLWLAHAESRRYAVDISHPETPVRALQQHGNTLTDLQRELQGRRAQQASLQALWCQLQPEDRAEESDEAKEKLHVTGSKLKLLLKQVDQDLITLQQRLDCESVPDGQGQRVPGNSPQEAAACNKHPSTQRVRRDLSPPRSFFYRVLRAAFPLHLLLLLLLLLPCLIPMSESDPSCTVANNFARSFYPMLHYTNGPPPT